MRVNPVVPSESFPFGTHVYREPYKDLDQLADDLTLLRELGFTMIKIQESWAVDEPAEGMYDFSRVKALIEGAAANGLGVYLGLTMEQAPAWMWRKFPDAHMVDNTGRPHVDPTQYSMPADAKPGPNWNHPGARAAAERFMRELVAQLGAYENVWVWNTFQEVGFWNNLVKNPEFLSFGYDPYTIARFRDWAVARHGGLDGLNESWATAYTDIEQIDPPRRYTSSPAWLAWQHYMYDVYLTEQLEWKTEVLRAADPRKRPVFAHVGHPTVGSGQEWRWAAAGDFFGSSNYPAWDPFDEWDDASADREDRLTTEHYELWHAMLFRNDLVRCATGRGRAFWGAEFQGGPISTFLHMGRTPSADDIRRWVLAGLASGMHGISFWNHRAEHFWHEGNGFGLLDRTESTSERIAEAGRLAKAINADPRLFVSSEVVPAQVAILVDENRFQFMAGSRSHALHLLQANLRGHYARLFELGIAVDFVESGLARPGDLDQYKAVILPLPLTVSSAEAALVDGYVAGGGTLISEVAPGRHDEFGFTSRTGLFRGAEELFGARHRSLTLVDEPGDRRWLLQPRGAGEIEPVTELRGTAADARVLANLYLERFDPTTGETILVDDAGETVGVRNTHGDGTAILIGTMIGTSAITHAHPPTDDFVAALLAEAGVVSDRVGRLIRRRRALDGDELWFLINTSGDAVTEAIDAAGARIRGLLGDEVPGGAEAPSVTVPPMGIVCLVVER
jgi:beta-galactosidase